MHTAMLQAGLEPALRGVSVRGLYQTWATAAKDGSDGVDECASVPLPLRHFLALAARRIRTCNLHILSVAPLASWATAARSRPPRESNPHDPALQAGASPFGQVAVVRLRRPPSSSAEAAGVEPASLSASEVPVRYPAPMGSALPIRRTLLYSITRPLHHFPPATASYGTRTRSITSTGWYADPHTHEARAT